MPPKARVAPPPLGFLTLGAWEAQGGAHQPTRGWFPCPLSLWALWDRWPHPVDPWPPFSAPGTKLITPKPSGGRNRTSNI